MYEGVAFLSAWTVATLLCLLPRRCDTHLVSRLYCIQYLTDNGTWHEGPVPSLVCNVTLGLFSYPKAFRDFEETAKTHLLGPS